MFIDIKTLLLIYNALVILGIIAVFSIWLQNRKQSPEIALWLIFYVMQFTGIVLVSLRGVIPDAVSIVVANSLLIGGMIALYIGLDRYLGFKSRQLPNYIIFFLFVIIHSYFTFVKPSLALRNINLSSGIIILCAQAVRTLFFRTMNHSLKKASRVISLIFFLMGLNNVFHIIENIINYYGENIFTSGVINAVVILIDEILLMSMTLMLVLLVNQKLSLKLKNQIYLFEHVQDELIKHRQSLSILIEYSTVGFCVKDKEGRYLLVNRKWENDTGIKREDAIGNTDADIFALDKENAEKYRADDLEVIRTGAAKEFEMRIGKTYIYNNIYPLKDENGNITGICSIGTDITKYKNAEDELRASKRFLSEIIEHSGTVICIKDKEGHYTLVNRKWEETSGLRREDVFGKTDLELFPGQRGNEIFMNDLQVMNSGRIYEYESNYDGIDRKRSFISIVFPVKDGESIIGVCAIATNITDRKRAEELLYKERQRLSYILEGTNAGTWEWNFQTGISDINERWAEMIGYSAIELRPIVNDTLQKLIHPDDFRKSREILERHMQNELPYYECEIRMRHKDGNWIWVLDRGKVVTWTSEGKPVLICGTHQDITSRKYAEEQIIHMATHDALTGLPSLKLARDRLTLAINMARRQNTMVAVMFIDLDGFKDVNDSFGHEAGDFVLKQVAERLRSSIREIDTVARIGGDEFLIIASVLHSETDAELIARKAIQLVYQPIKLRGQILKISASIGIALCINDCPDMDDMIKQADNAMYEVKRTGKNNFAFAIPS